MLPLWKASLQLAWEWYLRLFVKVSLVDLMAAKMRIRILWNRLPKALGESFSKMCHRPMRLASLLSMRLPLAAMGPTGAKLDMLTGSLCTIGYQSWVGARAPRSHTTHTTRHNFGYRNTLTATKLPACIHCRCSSKRAHPIGAAHLRSLLLKDLRCSTLVPRTRTRHTRLYLRLSL